MSSATETTKCSYRAETFIINYASALCNCWVGTVRDRRLTMPKWPREKAWSSKKR